MRLWGTLAGVWCFVLAGYLVGKFEHKAKKDGEWEAFLLFIPGGLLLLGIFLLWHWAPKVGS